MKILHLCHDEKVIPFVQRVFEVSAPGCSEYRIWGPRPGSATKHARLGPKAVLVPKSYWYSRRMREDVRTSDIVIVHYLTPNFARAVRAATDRQLVVWCGWGGDYYGLLPGYANLLMLPLSRRLDDQCRAAKPAPPPAARLKAMLKTPIRWLEHVDDRDWISKALARVDYFVSDEAGYDLLRAARPEFRAGRLWIPYYCVEDVPALPSGRPTGQDILLGNSATATNNHVEAILSLSRLDLTDRRVIVPLSYGDERYADQVCEIGRRLLGDAFVPLRKFLSLQDYLHVIQSCSVFVMNNVRAQGVGNIVAAYMNGAKVCLRPENHLTPFFRRRGMEVTEWQDQPVQSVLDDSSPASRERNRQAAATLFSMQVASSAVRDLQDRCIPELFPAAAAGSTRSSWRSGVLGLYNRLVEGVRSRVPGSMSER